MEHVGDIYDERRGEKARNHDRVVQRYFQEFAGCEVKELRGKPEPELREIYGRFANFLFTKKEDTGVPGWQTAMNYMSSLSQVFKQVLFEKRRGIFADEEWYNGVRSTLSKKYLSRSRERGEPLVDSPDPLTAELTAELCQYLYDKNTKKSMKDRAFILNQWHLLGRVSELTYLRNREVSAEDDHCYPDIPRGEKIASYINGVLRDFVNFTEKKVNLTSHSGRHGAAGAADGNSSINVFWIVERGEWIMDRINTAFEYIFGNSRNDRKVARVLAGWPNCNAGGLPPLLQDVPDPELQAKLSDLAQDLFSQSLPLSLKEFLLAIQLYRFDEVYRYKPDHLLVSMIIEHASSYDLNVEDLHSVSQTLFRAFQRHNLAHLSLEDSPESIATRLTRLTDAVLELRVETSQKMDELRRQSHQNLTLIQGEIAEVKELVLVLAKRIESDPRTHCQTSAAANNDQTQKMSGNVQPKRPFPNCLTKLGGLTLADAYYEYIRWGLTNCVTANKKECNALSDLRQLYNLARKLEPSFLLIPDPPSFHGEEFRAWRDQVKPRIQQSAQELQQKIEKFHENSKVAQSNVRKRRATDKAMASLKRMRGMIELGSDGSD
ncbi:hypothetical protein R1sor_024260 [Riccia sorocarpa]|uniref:Uncharacterized protein n=1 Tax=Riccia sorocarpa TaxID=122646 RepID=A0ABD3GW17_9MARC